MLSSLKYYRHMEAILIPYRNTLKNKEKGNVGTDRMQITLKRNASSATAELLFHF